MLSNPRYHEQPRAGATVINFFSDFWSFSIQFRIKINMFDNILVQILFFVTSFEKRLLTSADPTAVAQSVAAGDMSTFSGKWKGPKLPNEYKPPGAMSARSRPSPRKKNQSHSPRTPRSARW